MNGETVDVVGPICESGDYLAKARALPTTKRGDLLAVFTAGAYGFSMASNYNNRPRVPEVLVDGDKFTVIRRRETLGGSGRVGAHPMTATRTRTAGQARTGRFSDQVRHQTFCYAACDRSRTFAAFSLAPHRSILVTITIDPTAKPHPIPADFVGLAFETSMLLPQANGKPFFSATDTASAQNLREPWRAQHSRRREHGRGRHRARPDASTRSTNSSPSPKPAHVKVIYTLRLKKQTDPC